MTQEPSAEVSERQQQAAIHHRGGPARLLAGPGTGKTYALTQRVIDLVEDPQILPTDILALTFTRAAAQELRTRVREAVGDRVAPYVATLHSFALSELLKNAARIDALPQPLRIADDWEEKKIIREDMKVLAQLGTVKEVDDLFDALAADWETLRADENGWEETFPNPAFLGAWLRHRELYGYTLRSELVYQLKKATETIGEFHLSAQPRHLLVDEYQDLNPCDMAVIGYMQAHGAELFVAGDDDQSIYGFRHAHPLGIRQFVDSNAAADLRLEICRRCDPEILKIGAFVIGQEVGRIAKALRPEDDRAPGNVELHHFRDQDDEASWIAEQCADIVAAGTPIGELLILLRSDKNGAFSRVLRAALERHELLVHTDVGEPGPFDSESGRILLSLLRVALDGRDSLALRALMMLDENHLGAGAARAAEGLAGALDGRFVDALDANQDADLLGGFSNRVRDWYTSIRQDVEGYAHYFDMQGVNPDDAAVVFADRLVNFPMVPRIRDEEGAGVAVDEFQRIAASLGADRLESVLRSIGVTKDDEEPVVDPNAVNILSMHKAKGLGKQVAFIVAAETEYMPGWADTDAKRNEERRLLYVSLTRARNRLYITYCDRRTGGQHHTGNSHGRMVRHLTPFLQHSYLHPIPHM